MRTHARLARPQRRASAALRTARPGTIARPNALTRPVVPLRGLELPEFVPNPYVDYGRMLTAEGGVLMFFKDYDLRLRHTLWRLFAWLAATGLEGWFLLHYWRSITGSLPSAVSSASRS